MSGVVLDKSRRSHIVLITWCTILHTQSVTVSHCTALLPWLLEGSDSDTKQLNTWWGNLMPNVYSKIFNEIPPIDYNFSLPMQKIGATMSAVFTLRFSSFHHFWAKYGFQWSQARGPVSSRKQYIKACFFCVFFFQK